MTTTLNATIAALKLPARISRLPISDTGYPIPWFVAVKPDGTRDIRIADEGKRGIAVRRNLCWVCGEPLGRNKAFVIGPMCVVNRTTSEPPCHLECARFSAIACPFLTKPRMRRNDSDLPEGVTDPPGIAIRRNPGVTCVWVCDRYRRFTIGKEWLIGIGDPSVVEWYANGREATRAEVEASVTSGYPLLLAEAKREVFPDSACRELEARRVAAARFYPKAA